MLAAAAPLLAGAADPAADRALLQAFEGPCQHIRDFDRARSEAVPGGWTEIDETADPRIARLAKAGRDAVGDDGTLAGATFRRTHQGREVFLMVTRYVDETGIWGNGCRLYDFDAAAAIPLEVAQGWIGKPPTGSQSVDGGMKYLWEPWVEGRSLELNHVVAGSDADQRYGLRGVIVVAQALGGFGSLAGNPEEAGEP